MDGRFAQSAGCRSGLSTAGAAKAHPKRAGAAPLLAIPVGNRSVDAEATTGLAANGHMMMVGETGEESPFAATPRRNAAFQMSSG